MEVPRDENSQNTNPLGNRRIVQAIATLKVTNAHKTNVDDLP